MITSEDYKNDAYFSLLLKYVKIQKAAENLTLHIQAKYVESTTI